MRQTIWTEAVACNFIKKRLAQVFPVNIGDTYSEEVLRAAVSVLRHAAIDLYILYLYIYLLYIFIFILERLIDFSRRIERQETKRRSPATTILFEDWCYERRHMRLMSTGER